MRDLLELVRGRGFGLTSSTRGHGPVGPQGAGRYELSLLDADGHISVRKADDDPAALLALLDGGSEERRVRFVDRACGDRVLFVAHPTPLPETGT